MFFCRFLKDFPSNQTLYCEKFSSDAARWNLYPNLNYSALYYAIVNLLDVFPLITTQPQAIGEAILDTIKALMIFLERDSLEQLPLLLASQLGVFPRELDKQIVHLLADCVFPFAITNETFVKSSVPGVIMLVLQQTHDPSLHTWIIEAAMNCSPKVYQDLLQVNAKGTCESRVAAANLLFHYWPFPNPQILHRKTIQYRVHAWRPVICQSTGCTDKAPSVKRCYDPVVCADVADTSPPIFLCKKCAEQVTGERKVVTQHFAQPMPASNATCQRQDCQSQSRLAVTICVSHECTRTHNHVPLRLCLDCSGQVHGEESDHITHWGTGIVWGTDDMWPTVESIVKLLRETTMFEGSEGEGKKPKWLRQLDGGTSMGKEIDKMADERRMLSRFGVWLMAALCPPNETADPRAIGYIMQNVFEWFATTALLPNDSMGSALEQLKTDFVCDWINVSIRVHNNVFISSLCGECEEHDGRPHIDRIKEGLGRLLALMPYDVISLETWCKVMPIWLESIVNDCTEDNQPELKVLLSKIFEPDLCPLPFETIDVFQFMTNRMIGDDYNEMFNALQWLHQLSRLDITVPLNMVLDNFTKCLLKLRTIEIPPLSENDLEEEEMSVHVVLVDILVLQMRLNDVERSCSNSVVDRLFECIQLLISIPIRASPHQCHDPELDGFADCSPCQQAAFVQQMVMNITQKVCPKREVAIITTVDDDVNYDEQTENSPTLGGSSMMSPLTEGGSKGTTPGIQLPNQQLLAGLQTMCVAQAIEDESEECEFVGILPAEEMEVAMAEAVTHDAVLESGTVVTATTVHPSIKGQIINTPLTPQQKQNCDFWVTSVGRFRFSFDNLPAQLKMIHSLLSSLDSVLEPDVEFFCMTSLKYLCLHCEALSNARREHRGFLIWTQENQMVPKLWERLRSDFIQVGELATHLLLHAMTLPSGEEMFWKMVHRDFTSPQWNVRFDAVGKAYVIAQMMKAAPVKANKVVQTCLSSVFYHFISSLHDPNPSVAQRAIIALRAMPSHTLKLMCLCFESQFDHCIVDRPLIIHAITMLATLLPDQTTLTFDFFIQRFETLVLESQLSSQSEDTMFVQDLMHTDPMSELYQRKVSKARTSIENAQTARSIVRHLKSYDGMKHQLAHLPSDPANNDDLPTVSSPQSTVAANYGHGGYGRLREFTDEESNMCLLFNRVVDMENPERHTVYLVVSLFVTFLSNKNSTPNDEKANVKKQSLVFRHFNTLLGYSSTEKCFTIPPARLRKAAVCNAFVSGLPEILDMNLHIGNQLLPTVVQLLIHLPSPQKLASDQNVTNYSLALLTQHTRHLWLQSLILILYKYRFDQLPISENIVRLIGIVVKTLQNQVHECSDGEPCQDLDTWDNVEEPNDNLPGELIRPESLTVTGEGMVQVGAIRVMQPTIVEPSIEPRIERKKSSVASHKKSTSSPTSESSKGCKLRCGHCNEAIEMFDEETVSLCLIALETFLHREPSMAAPILFKILYTVTRLIDEPMYPWHSTEMFVPANSRSVAKQMLRVSLHHLSTSAICLQLFDTKIPRAESFWSVVALSLADFNELSPVYFIQLLMEDLEESWPSSLRLTMKNLAYYTVEIPTDMYITHWTNLVQHLETFFRRYHTAISADNANPPTRAEIENVVIVMSHVLKVQNFSSFKSAVSLVESFAKWMSEALHGGEISLESLLTICTACNRALIRERDKQCVTRAVVSELMQAIKFKAKLHESNYVTIANMILQDAGEDIEVSLLDDQFNTAASEAVKPFLFELLDFIADLHVIAKLKKESNSDSLGGDLKVKLAEAIAVQMSRSNARDCRTIIQFIPWLMSPPSVTQSAPGAFADSVTNVRVLSWLLLGALHANHSCLPVPIECSQHMADYIHFVLAGFADQSKQSVVHMSALFHAFHLCQLWTVYCERAAIYSSTTAFAHLIDFWARVTPAILQLLSHSKVLADMVNLHFLNTIQALQQVNSALLCQLYSMWAPILTAYHSQIPNQLRMKLDSCQNQPSLETPMVNEWLKKVRYKISQVELQTSAASPFYNV
ncbi:unnamed protein product [Caenorhabditis angaria]|uniref:Uncoordinated protein 79 n=1 Tax=Caenorhabditis angaria TaxID=860376 RepID=A0A9P1IKX8_9PELO|nr:unnamed protein product [Caenorhabditis angaria]